MYIVKILKTPIYCTGWSKDLGPNKIKKHKNLPAGFEPHPFSRCIFFLIMNESPNIDIPLNVYTRVDWIVLMNCYQRESWIPFKTPLRDSLMKLVITKFHH